jgi:hypothetical protein
MNKLIINRRRFLFVAPAIVAASSLMPSHSIAHVLTPKYKEYDNVSSGLIYGHPGKYIGSIGPFSEPIDKDTYRHNVARILNSEIGQQLSKNLGDIGTQSLIEFVYNTELW